MDINFTMNKKEIKITNALKELDKAIKDVQNKYGDSVDIHYLKKKFEEILNNINNFNK